MSPSFTTHKPHTIAVMSDNPIRLVCFDLGGVLIRICRSWREGCLAAGLPLRLESIEDPSSANGRKEISRLYQTGRMSTDQYWQELSASTDNLYTPHEIERIHYAWLLSEYEGVSDVIDAIHAANIKTACLSNTNHAHWVRMDEFPAVMKLHHRHASHELGLAKPDAAIYREFERLTNSRREEILFFDDLPENVETAKSIGWQCVQIDPNTRTDTQILAALRKNGVDLD
jgi:putative hydrolase of the HAD superfamily